MKKTVRNYIILGISLAALIFGIVIWGIDIGQQFAKYNHGIRGDGSNGLIKIES